MLKKISNLSIAAIMSLSATGCSYKEVKKSAEINEFKEALKDYKPESEKAVEEIKISGYTLKENNLNQKLIEDYSVEINLKNKKLGDLTQLGNYTVIVDPLISNRLINLNSGIERGKISEVLNKIAYATDSYWTNERGVIKFIKTAQIVYTFPALSLTRIQEIYNIGEKDMASKLDIKESIFTDLNEVITGLVESYSLEGTIVYNNENKQSKAIDATKVNNVNSENSQNKSFTENEKKESTNDISKDSKETNTFNSDMNISMEPDTSGNIDPNGAKKQTNIQKSNDKIINKGINDSQEVVKDKDRQLQSMDSSGVKQDKNTAINQNGTKSTNGNKLELAEEVKMKENFKSSNKRIVISPNSGTVIASLTPNEERILDTVLNTVMEKRFGNMIRLKTYALVVDSERAKNFNAEFSSLIQFNGYNMPASLGGGNFGFTVPQRFTPNSGDLFNTMIQYLTADRQGEVLINPSIVALPNVLSRIQDTSNIPYLEPTDLGNDNGTVSYGISYVEEGVNMSAIANVFDDNIIMALKFSVTQYLGNKTIAAGVLGSFDLPLSAPKIIQTTYRVSPGDILVLGGLKQSKYNKEGEDSFVIPTKLDNSNSKNEFIFIVMPTLIKFVVDPTLNKNNKIKDLKSIDLSLEQKELLNGKNSTENVKVIKSDEVVKITSVEEVIKTKELPMEETNIKEEKVSSSK